ncbi:hypothetical protein PO909_028911 [Leuciscus waleckii]
MAKRGGLLLVTKAKHPRAHTAAHFTRIFGSRLVLLHGVSGSRSGSTNAEKGEKFRWDVSMRIAAVLSNPIQLHFTEARHFRHFPLV